MLFEGPYFKKLVYSWWIKVFKVLIHSSNSLFTGCSLINVFF